MTRTPWYESENPSTVARGAGWRITAAVIAVVVLCAIAGGIALALNTATAPVRGQAHAYQQKESANNRIFAQQEFEKQYADIQSTEAKTQAAKDAGVVSEQDRIDYQGLIQHCMTVAGEYNAAARSYTSEQFRAADLPAQIDPTECESAK